MWLVHKINRATYVMCITFTISIDFEIENAHSEFSSAGSPSICVINEGR